MNFKPRSEAEIIATSIWPAGIYTFTIIEAEEKKSLHGNNMIEIELEISRKDGAKRKIRDWLLPQRPQKLLRACRTCGLSEQYGQGVLSDDDFLERSGKLRLGIKRETGEYPRRNVVLDYL
jgi:hypothetical protein